jgi:hypothetical protein
VWDLTHDGATIIPGAPVDSGTAAQRVPVAPGNYTVKLTASGQTLKQSVTVEADPRWLGTAKQSEPALIPMATDNPTTGGKFTWKELPLAEVEQVKRLLAGVAALDFRLAPATPALAEQERLALRIRDDITKLSDTVLRLRAIKKQLDLRKDLLKEDDAAKDLLKQSEALGKKLDGIEAKLHNPKAKITYDIFGAKGGAMLYSQLVWLITNLTDSDGEPTKAQRELADDLEKQLTGLVGQFDGVVKNDMAKLNDAAKKLGVPELYVPPAKKK